MAVAFGIGWWFHCAVERRFINTRPVELASIFVAPARREALPDALDLRVASEAGVSSVAEG
jgi:hypothetical protein